MHRVRILNGFLLSVFLVSCGLPPTTSPPPSTPQIESPGSASTPLEYSSPDPGTAWRTQIHELGVSINYPPNWTPEITSGGAVFISPTGSRILWEIYPRPLSERGLADPTEWVPNEGGYEIHWSKSISIPHAEGLEFIWGVYQENSWDGSPQLMAILYSEDRELDIRLSTFFDSDALAILDEVGPDRAISTELEVFRQMLESLQIDAN
ncbi:MAG: hypothetical protein WBB69_06255 [Anaerolineales bacterium]